jgi:hypothetical protein
VSGTCTFACTQNLGWHVRGYGKVPMYT